MITYLNDNVIYKNSRKVIDFLCYFSWYFNEHSNIEKQLQIAMQGTIIRALSVQMLRELQIILPPLEVQKAIGKIYTLKKRKEKLLYEKIF